MSTLDYSDCLIMKGSWRAISSFENSDSHLRSRSGSGWSSCCRDFYNKHYGAYASIHPGRWDRAGYSWRNPKHTRCNRESRKPNWTVQMSSLWCCLRFRYRSEVSHQRQTWVQAIELGHELPAQRVTNLELDLA